MLCYAPKVCDVKLESQASEHDCTPGVSFGCTNGTTSMWVSNGCRGIAEHSITTGKTHRAPYAMPLC